MVSTRKRSYSSSKNDSGYDSDSNAEHPVIKRPKPAIAESNRRKRKINVVSSGSEVKMNSRDESQVTCNFENDSDKTISKKPRISANKNINAVSISLSSTATTTSTNSDPSTIQFSTQELPSESIRNNIVQIIDQNQFNGKKGGIIKALKEKFEKYLPEPTSKNCCIENEIMCVECPEACERNSSCKNRFISNRSELKIVNNFELFYTDQKEYGIRAKHEIPEGTYIGDYNGEIINEREKQRRYRQKNKSGSKSFYMMKLWKFYIDAEHFGSHMRYLNHSCEPNCETKLYVASNGLPHICLFAIKNIVAGEELTFKYSPNNRQQNEQEFECYCGAKNSKHFFTA